MQFLKPCPWTLASQNFMGMFSMIISHIPKEANVVRKAKRNMLIWCWRTHAFFQCQLKTSWIVSWSHFLYSEMLNGYCICAEVWSLERNVFFKKKQLVLIASAQLIFFFLTHFFGGTHCLVNKSFSPLFKRLSLFVGFSK